ncbi:MAG: YidC/Oxa1 family membrane protein insertase [Chloroflexota bacterium]|nr:YidC/Oxa1 family membrane protein insertase [Chloroflexota bacterium]
MEILGLIWNSFWHLLLNILVVINSVVGSPGISIILFTLFMRLLTVPLTMKSLRSSRNMQQIQPLVKEIQRKYPKDRAKQQEETMKLYHQYGVNPAAGCFPMLVQLPIFIGLYSALSFTLPQFTGTEAQIATQTAAHLQQLKSILWNPDWVNSAANFSQAFLWVPKLAAADPLHIWPVVSGLFQFIQSRMSMPRRDPTQPLDSQTKMMQNMMQFMPLYIVFISWGFPAGTVIYWAFSSLFGAVQQYFITGFGTLPDLPGLGFLPRKPISTPAPLSALPAAEVGTGTGRKKAGVMGWMMDKALEAQEAQKATQASGLAAGESDGATTVRVKKKGSEPHVKAVPTTTLKYASDLKYRGNGSENGAGGADAPVSTTPLPRKRRGKR